MEIRKLKNEAIDSWWLRGNVELYDKWAFGCPNTKGAWLGGIVIV